MSAYRYNVNIDRGVIVRKWNDGQTETFKLDDLPENVIRYAAIQGLKERLGSGGIFAGKGDWKPKALRDLAAKEYAELCAGNVPTQRDAVLIPTRDQLFDAFRLIADDDATNEQIMERVMELHPDSATNEKVKKKCQKRLRELMDEPKLRDALIEIGFTPPARRKASIDDVLKF